jgi:flagellum-specific peptidoglycan hydrolase FlgJ
VSNRDTLFPQLIVLAAQHAERSTGILTCCSLGQGALESAYFTQMPRDSFNCLGIKAVAGQPYVECMTQEYYGGAMHNIIARFAKYTSFDAAFLAHGQLLSDPNGPYRSALQWRDDWQEFMEVVGPIYATDINYASKVIAIINQYSLFDWNLPSESDTQTQV